MVLLLLKLGTLALRTLSKPIAVRLKKEAGLHPKFRNFIISIAQIIFHHIHCSIQANHRITTTMQRRIYSHATDVGIRPLNEEKAVQAAVDLLGELFVFAVAGAIIVFEVQRNSRAEAKKEELRRQETEKLRLRDEALEKEIMSLRSKIQELEQLARGKGLAVPTYGMVAALQDCLGNNLSTYYLTYRLLI
ncbi:OPA3-like protein isoform X1 [Solanum lycopersicum]|uniref:OPA3-like protein isoform X1 n=2 Tax=Solanum lycopersicum TaxID=4081 RepID=UPI000532FC58|nr:OPA3-like protein isoform X1 [Solanum lycopersicum]